MTTTIKPGLELNELARHDPDVELVEVLERIAGGLERLLIAVTLVGLTFAAGTGLILGIVT
jgi:hypothetical protein